MFFTTYSLRSYKDTILHTLYHIIGFMTFCDIKNLGNKIEILVKKQNPIFF
jgi:hypothetical protein